MLSSAPAGEARPLAVCKACRLAVGNAWAARADVPACASASRFSREDRPPMPAVGKDPKLCRRQAARRGNCAGWRALTAAFLPALATTLPGPGAGP